MSISSNLTEPATPALAPSGAIVMASLPARPRKRAPTHPGEIIAGILEDAEISGRAAAQAIGMSSNGMAKLLRGEVPVTVETALRIGKYFGNGETVQDAAEFWLRMQLDYDLWHAHAKLKDDIAKIEPLPKEEVEGLD
jgi:addiction module HigA family antidote